MSHVTQGAKPFFERELLMGLLEPEPPPWQVFPRQKPGQGRVKVPASTLGPPAHT